MYIEAGNAIARVSFFLHCSLSTVDGCFKYPLFASTNPMNSFSGGSGSCLQTNRGLLKKAAPCRAEDQVHVCYFAPCFMLRRVKLVLTTSGSLRWLKFALSIPGSLNGACESQSLVDLLGANSYVVGSSAMTVEGQFAGMEGHYRSPRSHFLCC
jgi:hypothetical protein